MSYDALTVSAIVIVVVLIFVIVLIGRSKNHIERKMRVLASQLILRESNEKAMKICKEIHEKYPDLCLGMDFTLRESNEDVQIDEWNSNNPKP